MRFDEVGFEQGGSRLMLRYAHQHVARASGLMILLGQNWSHQSLARRVGVHCPIDDWEEKIAKSKD